MFFLLRLAFWLGLVLLLLPLGLQGKDGREVSVFDAFGLVQTVISDARGFCDRQPQACVVGGEMAGNFAEKAQIGAKWLSDSLGNAPAAGTPTPAAPVPAPAPTQAAAQPHAPETGKVPRYEGLDALIFQSTGMHSLTPQDMKPAWGGEAAQPAAAPAQPAAPAPGRRPT